MTSAPRLSLHVPEPTVRPGGRPDFNHVAVPEAGEVPRPPIDVSPSDIRDFAYTMIRVLDDKGDAVGDWAGGLKSDDLRKGLRDMMLTRAFDARMLLSQRQGKTSFYIQCLGEEAIATAHRKALKPGDMCFPTYRQQGLLIAYGFPIVDMMCQIFANENDRLKGRQLPGLYSSKEAGFFTVSGNLGTQYPQAVGWAMASAISGDTRIASGWIGEGATAETRLPFGAGVRFRLPPAGHSQRRQQPVGDLVLSGHRRRGERQIRRPRARLRHPLSARRRQRLSRGLCGFAMGGRAGARQSRARPSSNG